MKTNIDNSSSYSFNLENKTLEIYLTDKYFSLSRVVDDSLVHFLQSHHISIVKIHAFKKYLYSFLTDIKNNTQVYPVYFKITAQDIDNGKLAKD